jgi:hypothetical protein
VDQEGKIIQTFLEEMRDTPVFREYHHYYKTRDPHVLRFLLTFLNFGRKLKITGDDLESEAFRSWLEIEDSMGTSVPNFSINLRHIVEEIFLEWSADAFLPKHGGGAVAERGIRGTEAKNRHFYYDPKICYLFRDSIFSSHDVDSNSYPDHESARDSLPPSLRSSRLKFVPKTLHKKRSICMEPIMYQWAQQGVRLWFERAMEQSLLRHSVFLSDQTMNQRAATFGAKHLSVDTIDLSAASDSVPWELVKAIFPAKVLKYLAGTRTNTVVTPDGSEHELKKFAPMGSALCFPTQTTIYAAIVMMCGIAYRWGMDWNETLNLDEVDITELYYRTFRTSLKKEIPAGDHRLQPFYIYGDDIICDSRITSNVVDALRKLGFRVNQEKSFVGNIPFRESCGIYSSFGKDVTPLLFKVQPLNLRMSIESLASYIDLANRAKEYGYTSLRSSLINFILRYPIQGVRDEVDSLNPVLFTDDVDESMAILCDEPRNDHLRRRWYNVVDVEGTHIEYQRDEVRSVSLGPRKRVELSEKFDNYRYVVWWRSRYHECETRSFESEPMTTDTLGVGASWRWTAG